MQAIHGLYVLVLIRGAAAWSSTSNLAQQLHRRTSYYHDGRSPNTRLLMAEQEEEEDVAGVESPSKHSGYNVLGLSYHAVAQTWEDRVSEQVSTAMDSVPPEIWI